MSQKKLPTLVATRPVYLGTTVYTEGQPYVCRTEKEADEMVLEPSWRRATKKDLDAWANRLARDPAIAYLRSLPQVTETEYDEHPEDVLQAVEGRRAKAKADAEEEQRQQAAQKVADGVRATTDGVPAAKVEGDSQAGPSGAATGPVGIG